MCEVVGGWVSLWAEEDDWTFLIPVWRIFASLVIRGFSDANFRRFSAQFFHVSTLRITSSKPVKFPTFQQGRQCRKIFTFETNPYRYGSDMLLLLLFLSYRRDTYYWIYSSPKPKTVRTGKTGSINPTCWHSRKVLHQNNF